MRDCTNPETVERARLELAVAADASVVCEFLDRCEALDEDPAYELDELLAGWIKSKRTPSVGRAVSTRYGMTPESAPAFDEILEG